MEFLTLDQVLRIHERVLANYGGSEGIRDLALLQSAVATPQMSFGGQLLHDGIPAMAAAYLFHICGNHPFIDGNKRAALGSALLFLYANGHRLHASKDEVEQLTLRVADGGATKVEVTAFFRQHVETDIDSESTPDARLPNVDE